MAERSLTQLLSQLKSPTLAMASAPKLLSRAKVLLLQLNALTPTPSTPRHLLPLARETYELGALVSIRALGRLAQAQPARSKSISVQDSANQDALTDDTRDTFVRYINQLKPFYDLPAAIMPANQSERSKVTGLYLLLLLTEGRYAEFHSELEGLTTQEEGAGLEVEGDRFLSYPVRLERWLMEGSYDRVWKAMKSRDVPCEEYGVFSDILTRQIRSEIAGSSERAYPKLLLSSTKSLLFLESEGAVIEFANQRGWVIKDGEIYFPEAASEVGLDETVSDKDVSRAVIENALGYARELETIV